MDTKTFLVIVGIIIIIGMGIWAFIEKGLKFALCIVFIFALFTVGFVWLPDKIDAITNKEMTISEIIDCIKKDGCGIDNSFDDSLNIVKNAKENARNIIENKVKEAGEDLVNKAINEAIKNNTNSTNTNE